MDPVAVEEVDVRVTSCVAHNGLETVKLAVGNATTVTVFVIVSDGQLAADVTQCFTW